VVAVVGLVGEHQRVATATAVAVVADTVA